MKKTVKINMESGAFKILKDVVEFVSGFYYFFVQQESDSNISLATSYEMDGILDVELKTKNGSYKKVKLKKNKKL